MNPAPAKLYFKQASFLITMERELAQGSTLYPTIPAVGFMLSDEGLLVRLLKSSSITPVCTTNSFVWGSMVDSAKMRGLSAEASNSSPPLR